MPLDLLPVSHSMGSYLSLSYAHSHRIKPHLGNWTLFWSPLEFKIVWAFQEQFSSLPSAPLSHFFNNISAIKYHQTLSYRDQKLLMKKFWTILLESELETSKARSRNPLKVNAKEKEKGVLPISQGRLPWPSHSTINSELLRRGSAQQPMSHFLLRSRR